MIILLRQFLVVGLVGGLATGGAAYFASSSFGMDNDLRNQVSLRQATPMAGRMIIGGGLRGGK